MKTELLEFAKEILIHCITVIQWRLKFYIWVGNCTHVRKFYTNDFTRIHYYVLLSNSISMNYTQKQNRKEAQFTQLYYVRNIQRVLFL